MLIVGPQAEARAESLEPGELVMVEGKLVYKAGPTKDAGKLMVTTFAAKQLLAAAKTSNL
jgi:single-stranded DNA-binding protein